MIGITGFSGSNVPFKNTGDLTPLLFDKLVSKLEQLVLEQTTEPHLVSGGSSWADHVAVALCLKNGWKLDLYLPCKWNTEKAEFVANPTVNGLHRKFSQYAVKKSLQDLSDVMALDTTTVHICNGFQSRNKKMAKAVTTLFTISWDPKCPKSGCTFDIWKSSTAKKIHIDVNTLN